MTLLSTTPAEHKDCWRTQPEIFAALDAEFCFQLDVAASADNHLCNRYITEEINCLTYNWSSEFFAPVSYSWCNPPYSDPLPFIRKAADENKFGRVGVVMLLPADTSVRWFSEATQTASEIRFITNGRLQFINAGTGKPVNGNPKGSMLIIWHPWPRTHCAFSTVDRDELMKYGTTILAEKEECASERAA